MGTDREFVIEYCQNCSEHQWNTRHVEARYYEFFVNVKCELENSFPGCVVKAKPGVPRCGAFEVCDRAGRTFFSKLAINLFPRAGLFTKALVEAIEAQNENTAPCAYAVAARAPPIRVGTSTDRRRGNPSCEAKRSSRSSADGRFSSRGSSASSPHTWRVGANGEDESGWLGGGTFAEKSSSLQNQHRRVSTMKFVDRSDDFKDVKTANAPTEKGLAMAASARPKADVLGASNRSNAGMTFFANPYEHLKSRNSVDSSENVFGFGPSGFGSETVSRRQSIEFGSRSSSCFSSRPSSRPTSRPSSRSSRPPSGVCSPPRSRSHSESRPLDGAASSTRGAGQSLPRSGKDATAPAFRAELAMKLRAM